MSNYDVIIIGSGAGGGTLALKLAPSGKRILILERGGYLPREKQNWDATEVFVKNRYVSKDTWHDKDNKPFQPGVALFRRRRDQGVWRGLVPFAQQDFTAHRTADGLTPGWPIRYDELEPYYTQAKNFTTSMASAAMIRPIRPPARRIPFRPSATSRAFRNSPTT
jgi:choline dehydrogenase-like flavoprotein